MNIIDKIDNYINEAKAKFNAEEYSWGKLRKVSVGNKFGVVIHPEHHDKIMNVLDGKTEQETFVDETNKKWFVTADNGKLVFKDAKYGKTAMIPIKSYK